MANKRIIELNERTTINMSDFLMVDDATGSRKLAMSTLFNYLTYSSMMFVDTLPTTDIDPTVIYLVPHSGSTTQWDEYIYRDNQWILIGTSTLDLSSIYQTKTDNNLQTNSKQIVGAINEVKSALTDLPSMNSIDVICNEAVGTSSVNITLTKTPTKMMYFLAVQGNYIRQTITIPAYVWANSGSFGHVQLAWGNNYINITRTDATHLQAISNLIDCTLYIYSM